MKAPNYYQISSGVRLIRDMEHFGDPDKELTKRFRDAMAMFRVRVELLGNLDHTTTPVEEDSLTVILETLLEGKRRLQGMR